MAPLARSPGLEPNRAVAVLAPDKDSKRGVVQLPRHRLPSAQSAVAAWLLGLHTCAQAWPGSFVVSEKL